MAYLIHYNKNHSKKNGQFVSGDGDSDGIVDDHHNYSKNKVTSPKNGSSGVSKSLKKYTGEKGLENMKKAGFMKVAKALSKDYGKRYRDAPGKNTEEADKKYKKKLADLEEKTWKKYEQKGKIADDGGYIWDEKIADWYNKEYDKIVSQDKIDYGRAWMKDLGINEQDADVINHFLGKY